MTDEELYAAAEKEYGSDNIAIIRDIPISRGEDAGAWVPAYVWIALPEKAKEPV